MSVSRRQVLALLGTAAIAGCNQSDTDPRTTNGFDPDEVGGNDEPTTTGTAEVDGPTYELGDSFTHEFDLTRLPEYGITKTVLLVFDERGTLSYDMTVETSGRPVAIDIEVLPNEPGNLWGYLNYGPYSFEPDASATETTEADVTATLPAGEYIFVVDHSRFGASFDDPERPLDRVVATVDCELTATTAAIPE